MSHLKERKDKSCLNCNAIVNGRYCSVCGQENLEPQESTWHLIVHFFNDITHFDGKFFSSVKYVFTKPGFLTGEYVAGRRMAYLNPVRFYVFTSFIFFLILFGFFKKGDIIKFNEKDSVAVNKSDSIQISKALDLAGADSSEKQAIYNDSVRSNYTLFKIVDYKNREEYDSLRRLGKTTKKWYKKILIDKQFDLQEKYGNDAKKTKAALRHEIVAITPQILFLSLPFFALILKVLYLRRKKFYYVSHLIFTIHFYIFVYIIILLENFLRAGSNFKYLGWLEIVGLIMTISPVYYLYRAMRNFYEQSRWKTIFKLFILLFVLLFLVCFFLILLFALSIYKM